MIKWVRKQLLVVLEDVKLEECDNRLITCLIYWISVCIHSPLRHSSHYIRNTLPLTQSFVVEHGVGRFTWELNRQLPNKCTSATLSICLKSNKSPAAQYRLELNRGERLPTRLMAWGHCNICPLRCASVSCHHAIPHNENLCTHLKFVWTSFCVKIPGSCYFTCHPCLPLRDLPDAAQALQWH